MKNFLGTPTKPNVVGGANTNGNFNTNNANNVSSAEAQINDWLAPYWNNDTGSSSSSSANANNSNANNKVDSIGKNPSRSGPDGAT